MQDYPTTPIPQKEEIIKEGRNNSKLIKIALTLILLVLLIVIYFVYQNKKDGDIENAQASVLSQAIPLNENENFGVYKGQGGGLYSNNTNQPTLSHRVALQKQIQLVKPLDSKGVSDSSGKVGFIYLGDPFTKGDFETLSDFIEENSVINQRLRLVDGSEERFDTSYWEKSIYSWEALSQKVIENDLEQKQIQILWINLSYKEYQDNLSEDINNQTNVLQTIIKNALVKFPNIRIVYLSSPRNASNSTNAEYVEPNAFEAAFAIRELINRQEKGELKFKEDIPSLLSEPVMIWGPYLWTRESDSSYGPESFSADGLTFTTLGRQKSAVEMFEFWSNYEFSRDWFVSK